MDTPFMIILSHSKQQDMIDALHRYNDLKDAAQMLMGKYGLLRFFL
jgi:hypothetical protein